jgi:glucose/arabinose dehydrogenase
MLALSPFVSGLTSLVGFEAPNDGTNRIFILQQGGAIRIIQNGALLSVPFLDVSSNPGFESGGEKGLLGLAFHPGFNASGKFYVYCTRRVSGQLQSVFSEFTVSPPNANVANISSERQLLVVNQPFDNHNGGQLAFGPDDAYLYIGLGDGGSEGDPQGNGQNSPSGARVCHPGRQSVCQQRWRAGDICLRFEEPLALFLRFTNAPSFCGRRWTGQLGRGGFNYQRQELWLESDGRESLLSTHSHDLQYDRPGAADHRV